MVDIKPLEPHVVVVLLDIYNGRKIANLFKEAGRTRVDCLKARDLPPAWMDADLVVCCRSAATNAREAGYRGRIIVVLSELPTPQASAELSNANAESYFIGRSLDWVAEIAAAL